MLRKLCRHAGTCYLRCRVIENVRFRHIHRVAVSSTVRLTGGNEQRLFKSVSSPRSFSEKRSGFKDKNDFELKCEETLDSLAEYFDELVESTDHLDKADVNYGDGVLTVQFGEPYGTYVINRQSPNRQIWLSSPSSGPKRYDFTNGEWTYVHDGKSLHSLLNEEISKIMKKPVKFGDCAFGKSRN